MAVSLHVEMARQGAKKFNEWRATVLHEKIDLSNAVLCDCDLSLCNLSGLNLTSANLDRTILSAAGFIGTQLSGATFRGAIADPSPRGEVAFREATLENAVFDGASLVSAQFDKANLSGCSFRGANCSRARFMDASLVGSDLTGGDFTHAIFSGTDLTGAKLSKTKLGSAQLDQVIMTGADVSGADFDEARVSGGAWGKLHGATEARNLETTNVSVPARYFEQCELARIDRWCDWERLRTFGRLPLFGFSYSVLLFIPFYIYIIAWYNHQVAKLHEWHGPGGEWVGHHLHPLPVPSLSLFLLVSTILLAIASTIYTLCCPSRVKEFTRDVWCDQLRGSLMHYWPLAWRNRVLRVICGVFYVVGAIGVMYVLLMKVGKSALYIWENT